MILFVYPVDMFIMILSLAYTAGITFSAYPINAIIQDIILYQTYGFKVACLRQSPI